MAASLTRRRTEAIGDQGAVLVYHRIGTSSSDPLRLNIKPANLEQQLAVIASDWRSISLSELTDCLHEHGEPPAGSIAVTFDDGYDGVLSHALPLLERYGVPATAFVVSGFVGGTLWWEALDALVRGSKSSPARLKLDIGSQRKRWARLRRCSTSPLDQLFYSLSRRLSAASPAVRAEALVRVAEWSGVDVELEQDRRPLSAEGLRQLAASGIVEVGAHTVTHRVLAHLSPAEQAEEIAGSKDALEQLLGRAVNSFAYPYGGRDEYDASAVDAVRRAGYSRACANVQAPVRAGADPLQLPRLIVGDWDGATFARRLEQWLGHATANRVVEPA